jgi:hypothetical protein
LKKAEVRFCEAILRLNKNLKKCWINTELKSTRNLPGGKGRPERNADNLSQTYGSPRPLLCLAFTDYPWLSLPPSYRHFCSDVTQVTSINMTIMSSIFHRLRRVGQWIWFLERK